MSGAALLAHLRGLGLPVVWLILGAVYAAVMGVWNLVDDYRDARRGSR